MKSASRYFSEFIIPLASVIVLVAWTVLELFVSAPAIA